MMVALLQMSLIADSRAANLQNLIRSIDRASKAVPAPDILVLPGACDTGGATAGSGTSQANMQVVRETIASKAREWGVFVAAGLHLPNGDEWRPCAVLFDPDGDVAVCSRLQPTSGGAAVTAGPRLFRSVAGEMGVLEPLALVAGSTGQTLTASEAFVAMPLALGTTAGHRRAYEAAAATVRNDSSARGCAYWGVVAPAGKRASSGTPPEPLTFVCDPEGRYLASADDLEETTLYVDVPLRPMSVDVSKDVNMRGGLAD